MGIALLVVIMLYLLLGFVIVFNDFRRVYYNQPYYVTEKKYLCIPFIVLFWLPMNWVYFKRGDFSIFDKNK